jgi:hypothetical protein
MTTIYVAIAIFGMAAIFGIYLLSLILRNKTTPKGVTMIHGTMAAIALVLLYIYAFGNTPGPWSSAIIFTIAALGGFVLNYRDITGKTIPKWLGIVHGLAAISGFILLLVFAFNGDG